MLILGLKVKFRNLGLDINHNDIRHGIIINNAILNSESALNSNSSVAKYLSIIVIIIMLFVFFIE